MYQWWRTCRLCSLLIISNQRGSRRHPSSRHQMRKPSRWFPLSVLIWSITIKNQMRNSLKTYLLLILRMNSLDISFSIGVFSPLVSSLASSSHLEHLNTPPYSTPACSRDQWWSLPLSFSISTWTCIVQITFQALNTWRWWSSSSFNSESRPNLANAPQMIMASNKVDSPQSWTAILPSIWMIWAKTSHNPLS